MKNNDISIIESNHRNDNLNTGLGVNKTENHKNSINQKNRVSSSTNLEKEFSSVARLTRYKRLIKAGTPDDVIYRLILQGDKEGELEIDLDDATVNPCHRFAFLWVEACLNAQENNHWTDATPFRTFKDICFEEIEYNSRTSELEWKVNGETLNLNFFQLELKTMLDSINSDSSPLYKADAINDKESKYLAEEIIRLNAYNPINLWAKNLPTWDGKDRYKELLEVMGQQSDNQVAILFFEWMKAAMNRFLLPGSVNELVPILKGKQGSRKTTFCLSLHDFSNTLDSIGNDAENIRIKHKLSIGELGEFNGMLSVKAVEKIKREISRTSDPLRPLYVNTSIDLPRTFSYIATINNENFFTDTTGNRRFFVIEIPIGHQINITWVEENIEQIWAQVKQDGTLKGWFDKEQERIAAIGNKEFSMADDCSEFVEWLVQKFSFDELKEGILTLTDSDNHALKTLGFYLTKDRLEKLASGYLLKTYGNQERLNTKFIKNVSYILNGKGFSYKQHRIKKDAFNGETGNRLRYFKFEGEEII